MAWSIVAVGGASIQASGDLTPGLPTGATTGDLLVACIAYRSTEPFTLPANWLLIDTQQSLGDLDATGGIASGLMAYIVHGASPPSRTFTRTGGDVGFGVIVAYRGGNTSTPYDTGLAATLGAVGEPALAAISTAEANELLVAFIAHGDNTSTTQMNATDPGTESGETNTTTAPTVGTWIERYDGGSNTGADTTNSIFDAVKAGSGTTGAFSANAVTLSRSVMIVGAFKIAAGGPPTGIATKVHHYKQLGVM